MKKTALIIAGILMLCPTLLKAQQPGYSVSSLLSGLPVYRVSCPCMISTEG